MSPRIRETAPADAAAVRDIALAALGPDQGPEVARLIRALAEDPTARPSASLVAVAEDGVVGHILFTRAAISGPGRGVPCRILAPLVVHPAHQGRGLGGRLIAAGLEALRAQGVALVFVLGTPRYYGRHGFRPAGPFGIEAPHPIPAARSAAWMVRPLRPGAMGRVSGRVVCADVLNDPRHWRG